jgi:hypothetical protein
MINWGRLARSNRRGVPKSKKKKVPPRPKPKRRISTRKPKEKPIMKNEKPAAKEEPKAKDEPKAKEEPKAKPAKEKYSEPIGQEVTQGIVKPSKEALDRIKELEASTPEAIAATREKEETKKK